MKTPVTLESLVVRVKKEVEAKAKISDQKKREAAEEIRRRKEQPDVYQREELWFPTCVHREYEIQVCDCCKTETTIFAAERVELHHKLDKYARRTVVVQPGSRWSAYKGETPLEVLDLKIEISERIIPECFGCFTAGKLLQHLFRKAQDGKESSSPAIAKRAA